MYTKVYLNFGADPYDRDYDSYTWNTGLLWSIERLSLYFGG